MYNSEEIFFGRQLVKPVHLPNSIKPEVNENRDSM